MYKKISLLLIGLLLSGNQLMAADGAYFLAKKKLEERVSREMTAYQFEKEQRFSEAINLFEEIATEYGDSADASPSRNALTRLYEKTGQYDKALEQVEWFLRGNNQNAQGKRQSLEEKQRLLRKIEAQKKGSKMQQVSAMPVVSLSRSTNIISDFQKADYASQKKFLERNLPEETEILRLSKQAMLAEHAGKFAEAKGYYEQLLSRKEDVTAAQGDGAWPMLHCAVQRTAEVTGDEAREKEMLMWIKENMLNPQGQYHQFLSGLMPQVIDRLEKRIKKYQL